MMLADVARPEEAGLSAAGLDGVDAGLQALIDKGELAGAVTLVARHGRVARRSVLGFDSLEKKTKLKTDTVFRIFSMTKPVTAVAMMILYERGLWKPDDPVGKFIPAFNHCAVFAGLDDVQSRVLRQPHEPLGDRHRTDRISVAPEQQHRAGDRRDLGGEIDARLGDPGPAPGYSRR